MCFQLSNTKRPYIEICLARINWLEFQSDLYGTTLRLNTIELQTNTQIGKINP
jgi:hypothetical protein